MLYRIFFFFAKIRYPLEVNQLVLSLLLLKLSTLITHDLKRVLIFLLKKVREDGRVWGYRCQFDAQILY